MTAVRNNWFYVLLALCLMAAWQLSLTPETLADPLTTERIYLVDFALILPVLYFIYLRSRFAMRAVVLRSLGLGASGLVFAAWLMPEGSGQVLPWLAWLRWTVMPVIILVELAALAALVRYVFGSEPQEEALIRQGIPPLVVRLMLAEARFWKRVYRFLSGNRD